MCSFILLAVDECRAICSCCRNHGGEQRGLSFLLWIQVLLFLFIVVLMLVALVVLVLVVLIVLVVLVVFLV